MAHGPDHSHSGHAPACGHDHGRPAEAPAATPCAGHHHAPSMPHPTQAAPWSILRMGLAGRLGGALVVVAGLWIVILASMRAV
nr:hypothetical protein [Afipia carboxidovorans]